MLPVQYKLLVYLTMCGLNPYKEGVIPTILYVNTLLHQIILVILNFLELFLNWTGIESISNVYFLPISVLILAKSANMVINRTTFVTMFDIMDGFWATHFLGDEIEKKILNLHRISTFFVYSYIGSIMASVVIFTVMPLMERDLIYTGYKICDIKENPCYLLLYSWHWYLMAFVSLPSSMTFDCCFICFVGRGYSAIELVKYSLHVLIKVPTNSKERIILDENIGKIIQQHELILRYIKEMNKFYTGTMLTQFWTSLGTLIFSLFMITSKGIPPDSALLSKFGSLYVVICGQLFLYAYGGNIIIEQTKSVAVEAYAADWYSKTEPKLRQKLQFIIMRSQKYEKLTIGNMANLDLETFVAVLKNSVSVYTLLRTVELKSDMDI